MAKRQGSGKPEDPKPTDQPATNGEAAGAAAGEHVTEDSAVGVQGAGEAVPGKTEEMAGDPGPGEKLGGPGDPIQQGRSGGPTIEEYTKAGYPAASYPPEGFAEVWSPGLERFKETGRIDDPMPVAEPDADAAPEKGKTIVPMNNGATESTDEMRGLLLDACERFGVDPCIETRPQELASWNYYKADRLAGTPASVVIVTKGGVKLRHYDDPDYIAPGATAPAMDQDTEERLANIFQAFERDAQKNIVRKALPADLALPAMAVTGLSTKTEHRFRRGYLKEGGKAEAERRTAAAKAKAKK